jgi:hypothetical protein
MAKKKETEAPEKAVRSNPADKTPGESKPIKTELPSGTVRIDN